MLEKSHEYGLIHTLAREKAKLYGNAHQIEVLKNNLNSSFEKEPLQRNEPPQESSIKSPTLKKGKSIAQGKCSLHSNNNDLANKIDGIKDVYDKESNEHLTPSESNKTCKKCHRRINK